MSSTKFEIVMSNDDFIVVRDIETGQVFTYPAIVNQSGEYVLGAGSFTASKMSAVRPEDIARRVWNFAQMQMHQAGRVDRVFIQ